MTTAGDTSNFHNGRVKDMTDSMNYAIKHDGEVYRDLYIHVRLVYNLSIRVCWFIRKSNLFSILITPNQYKVHIY